MYLMHNIPLHNAEVGIWYTMDTEWVAGPTLYAKTIPAGMSG